MKVQVLTFRTVDLAERDILRHSDVIGLAIREFPGVLSGYCITDPRQGIFGGVMVWDDARSLDSFRHSELYARLMVHPNLTDPSDQEVAVGEHADLEELLLAA